MANMEPPKPDNRVTNLDNPSEIVKQVQKELVFNNSSNKDHPKHTEQKGTRGSIVSFSGFSLSCNLFASVDIFVGKPVSLTSKVFFAKEFPVM